MRTDHPIVFIPCGGRKRDVLVCRAASLYTGPLFDACLRWALSVSTPERVHIISAKYGLVGLNQEIKWYNRKLSDPARLAPLLRGQCRGLVPSGTRALSLLPQNYDRALSYAVPSRRHCLPPLGFGILRSLLLSNLGRLPDDWVGMDKARNSEAKRQASIKKALEDR